MLKQGEIPIFEPGLADLVRRNAAAGPALSFTTDLPDAIRESDFVFLAVGTPQGPNGSANLSALWTVAENIAPPFGRRGDCRRKEYGAGRNKRQTERHTP